MFHSSHFKSMIARRWNLTVGVFVLLVCSAVTNATTAAHKQFQLNNDVFTRRIQEQLRRNAAPLILPKTWQTNVSVTSRYPPWAMSRRSFLWAGCGWGTPGKFNFEQRQTKLPDDPTLILAAGYQKCERIDISILDSSVPVYAYPAGYFGDYVYESVLIADRMEFSDEDSLRHIFILTVEAAAMVDDIWPFWLDERPSEVTLVDFRKETGFNPELLIEFVGETNVRIEINLTMQRVLILSGDRWESYALDPGSAAALQNIASAKQAKLRQSRE